MLTWLYTFARFYLAPLLLTFADAEMPPAAESGSEGGGAPKEGGGFPRWLLILIIVVVVGVVGLCCIIFLVPLLLGPSIGNVFSNIVEDLETPQP